MADKDKFISQYEMIANGDIIDRLYIYQCLLYSGFDKDKAYDLIDTLSNMYLKDETNTCLGRLSDYLYESYNNDVDIENMTAREILMEIDWDVF